MVWMLSLSSDRKEVSENQPSLGRFPEGIIISNGF